MIFLYLFQMILFLITVPSFIKTGMDLGQVSFNPVYTIESYVNNQPVYRLKGFDFNIKK